MEQLEKISLLLGRIEQMQEQVIRLQNELAGLMQELALLKKSLSGPQSPFGIVYPITDGAE